MLGEGAGAKAVRERLAVAVVSGVRRSSGKTSSQNAGAPSAQAAQKPQ